MRRARGVVFNLGRVGDRNRVVFPGRIGLHDGSYPGSGIARGRTHLPVFLVLPHHQRDNGNQAVAPTMDSKVIGHDIHAD